MFKIKSIKKASPVAKWILIFFVFTGFLAPVLSNDKPLIASYRGKTIFPVFTQKKVEMGWASWEKDFLNIDWKLLPYDWAIWPPIPYLPGSIDFLNANAVSPFSKQDVSSTKWRHWLGTDMLGRDILAAMLHGSRTALLVAFLATLIAGFIGVCLGSVSGYLGDTTVKVTIVSMLLIVLALFLSWFWGFYPHRFALADAMNKSLALFAFLVLKVIVIITTIFTLLIFGVNKIERNKPDSRKINIPVDLIVSRGIEIFEAIPTLFLILSIIAIAKPSLGLVIIIIGFTAWPSVARFTRAEILRVKQADYVESAKALGIKPFSILSKHILPNAWQAIMITLVFTAASAILAESTLSFLGIGAPVDELTWGSLLSEARQAPKAWWLAVFPGAAIFSTVYCLNILGERK